MLAGREWGVEMILGMKRLEKLRRQQNIPCIN